MLQQTDMGIILKNRQEIEAMRIAGQLAGQVLQMIRPHVQAGVTTGELDDICHRYITVEQQAIPAPLNYRGFPKSICTSVNHVICHGIPGDKKLKNGDIINIDTVIETDNRPGGIVHRNRPIDVIQVDPVTAGCG